MVTAEGGEMIIIWEFITGRLLLSQCMNPYLYTEEEHYIDLMSYF